MDYSYLDSLAELGVGGAHPGGLKLTKKLLQRETIHQQTVMLDAGCGTGQTSAYVKEHYGCDVTAIDQHKLMVHKAKQRFFELGLEVNVKQGNTEELPFRNASFDLILSESVIAFTDASATLSEFKRVLKPNGVLLAIELVGEKPFSQNDANDICEFYQLPELLTEDQWYDVLSKSGFTKITTEKAEYEFDPQDVANAPDFSLSETIDPVSFDILHEHEYVMKQYKDVLQFLVFRCQ